MRNTGGKRVQKKNKVNTFVKKYYGEIIKDVKYFGTFQNILFLICDRPTTNTSICYKTINRGAGSASQVS